MKTLLLNLIMVVIITKISAQVLIPGSGSPSGPIDGSALLELRNGTNKKGFLGPQVFLTSTTTQLSNSSNANGLQVYNTNANMTNGNGVGYYFWDGTKWVTMKNTTGTSNYWSLTGNAGTVDGTNFIGTQDNVALNFRVYGQPAGRIDHILYNTSLGIFSANPNTTGSFNTSVGGHTLERNTTGIANTAVGGGALDNNTTGNENTGIGHDALIGNINGNQNTAVGNSALRSNTSGYSNTAVGVDALNDATTGYDNTALGGSALYSNTVGYSNTASGALALRYNTTGYNNTAVGNYALQNNVSGFLNSSLGFNAGPAPNNGSVHHAVAVGSAAVTNTFYSIAIGSDVTVNSSANGLSTAIGALSSVGANITNATVIGARAAVNSSNTIVLGDANITSLRCNVQSISTLSDKRIKENIKADVPGISFIKRLNPITYRINKLKEARLTGHRLADVQEDRVIHSGFLAQDVEAAAKAVGYDFEGVRQEEGGKYYTLGYTSFVIPLVQAVKELSTEIDQLKAELTTVKEKEKTTQNQLDKIEAMLQLSTRHTFISLKAK